MDQGPINLSINLSSVWHQQSRALHLTISQRLREGPSLPLTLPTSHPPSSTSLLLGIYFCLFPSHFPQSQPFALARQAPLRPPRRSGNMRAQEHGGRWLTRAAVASKDVHCGCTLPRASGWLTTWRRKEMENIWGHMGGTTTTTTTQANLLLCAHYVLTTCPRFLLNNGNKGKKNYWWRSVCEPLQTVDRSLHPCTQS